MNLNTYDVARLVRRLPNRLKNIMVLPEMQNKIFIAGGYIRAVLREEKVNDIDIFTVDKQHAQKVRNMLCQGENGVRLPSIESKNAITIFGKNTVYQIITRWMFDSADKVRESFDFTICASVLFYHSGKYDSVCDANFYQDLATKRLVYRNPVRNEDAGGSMLRMLKYYRLGYSAPLSSIAQVITRLHKGIDPDKMPHEDSNFYYEQYAHVVQGLLVEVDPSISPEHFVHEHPVSEE